MPMGRRRRRRPSRRRYGATVSRWDWRTLYWRWQQEGLRKGKLASALLVLLCGGLLYWFFASYDFYVYGASIKGCRFLLPDEVYQASGVDEMSIFYLDPAQVEEALSALPAVREARVRCWLPNRVVIEVSEREPRFVWETAESSYWVDEEGVLFPIRGDVKGVIHILDREHRPLGPGDKVEARVLSTVKKLQALLPGARRFEYSSEKGVALVTERGWLVYVGHGEALERKVAILKALEQELSARGVVPQYIDLRFQRPFYR